MEQYIPFIKYYNCKNGYLRRLTKKLREKMINLQILLKYKRYNISRFKKGTNWGSFTEEFVDFLLENKHHILRQYRGVFCSDEIYKHTLAYHSQFKEKIYDPLNEFNGCVREIDWTRGAPYTYTIEDLPMLLSSDKLFARKFDSSVDREIIDRICDNILKQ